MKQRFMLLMCSLFISHSAHSMPARVDPDVGSFLTIGTGYDLVTGSPMADCIVPAKTEPVSNGVGMVTAHLTYINDYESLAKSLEINSSAKLKLGMPMYSIPSASLNNNP
ncbi:MAG: hypothetical protein HQK52_18305 [Oligoflexia bacterium]|nr:hypothetical protein [Oligoflexia bacterium]